MNEVHGQTVDLLLDTLRYRGIVVALPTPSAKLDWEAWVELLARIEAQIGPARMERVFVPGAGLRTGHRFVQLANGVLSARDLHKVFIRWALTRAISTCSGTIAWRSERRMQMVLTIDHRLGSAPTLRFLSHAIRTMTGLLGLPDATLRIVTLDDHRAELDIELPTERSVLGRLRRLGRLVGGVGAALDELGHQASEIATQNAVLARQLEAAREHDTWLALALDAGRVGTWRWTPANQQVVISPKLAELLDLGDARVITTVVWGDTIHPDDRLRVRTTVTEAVRTRESFELEYRANHRWLRVAGRLVGTREPQMFGTAVDVTEQRQLDAQLRHADRMISAGTLAAGVAHEINNPLTYVLGNVELAQRRLREHPVAGALLKESFAQMLDGLERIRDVVADLRSFARPEEDAAGRLELSRVCDAAIRLVSSVVRHRAEITTDYGSEVPQVIANESRLGQVIINLMVNASHAMPERATTASRITIRTRRLPGGEAGIDVEDNGTGIDPDVLPRLFDPFFTTKQAGLGTGLGLSVCQSIVTSLGGRISVETALGRGTTFTIALPAAPPALAIVPSVPPPRASITGLRILVIDDEPMVLRTLARMLGHHGCAVTEAEGGIVGLALATSGTFDTVLCDLMMPDLDGAALHDELARIRPDLASRMVFISGGAVTPRTRAFVERPEITLLPKPFVVDALLGALANRARG